MKWVFQQIWLEKLKWRETTLNMHFLLIFKPHTKCEIDNEIKDSGKENI